MLVLASNFFTAIFRDISQAFNDKTNVAKLTACRAVARSYVVDTLSSAKGRVANRIEGTNVRDLSGIL